MFRPSRTVAAAVFLLVLGAPVSAGAPLHRAVGPPQVLGVPGCSVGRATGCYPGWPVVGYPAFGFGNCAAFGLPAYTGYPFGAGYPLGFSLNSSYCTGGYSSYYSTGSFYAGSYPGLNAGVFSNTSIADSPPAEQPTPALVTSALATAEVDLQVPAGAELWVQDVKMQQTGTVRLFVSPALAAGRDYRYRIRATYLDQGKEKTTLRVLTVRASDRLQVELLSLPEVAPSTTTAQR